jgi:hypothetical protein
MSHIQELLNQEAILSNNGKSNSEERKRIHTLIRLQRAGPAPGCFGDDDCSINMLVHCPWRIDCGS